MDVRHPRECQVFTADEVYRHYSGMVCCTSPSIRQRPGRAEDLREGLISCIIEVRVVIVDGLRTREATCEGRSFAQPGCSRNRPAMKFDDGLHDRQAKA